PAIREAPPGARLGSPIGSRIRASRAPGGAPRFGSRRGSWRAGDGLERLYVGASEGSSAGPQGIDAAARAIFDGKVLKATGPGRVAKSPGAPAGGVRAALANFDIDGDTPKAEHKTFLD